MAQLKEKTLEELKKMASKKKIEGRSKMNKAQLIRALSKCTSKSKKMVGGALSDQEIQDLVNRNYVNNPLTFAGNRPVISIVYHTIQRNNIPENVLTITYITTEGDVRPFTISPNKLVMHNNHLLLDVQLRRPGVPTQV